MRLSIQAFAGASLKPYIASLARLRIEIFRSYPYLRENKLEEEVKYLEKYLKSPDAIGVIVFDGSTIVGASLGLPLSQETITIIQPFLDQKLDVADYFYFGKSVLLQNYRGRGIGHHFFDLREAHVKELGNFQNICFWEVLRPAGKKPDDHLSLANFWRKRGYSMQHNLRFSLSWKDIGQEKATPKEVVYWTKELETVNGFRFR